MYLLDTHALLFFLNNDPALSLRARSIIENEWKLYINIVSFWEIAIKIGPGKLSISGSVTELIKYCEENQISILQIRASELERIPALPLHHRDPFDRLLICQALDRGLTILTRDQKIWRYEEVETVW